MDLKLTESSRKKRKGRMREWVRLVFCRRSAKDLVRVLEIGHDVWKMRMGTNSWRILKTIKFIFQI